MEREFDYALEKRLNKLNKELHKKLRNSIFSMRFILKGYQTVFPFFTDHTIVHSMNVIDFCNKIIGKQIDLLNADEIYIILMACYLHDSGMGISMDDYISFSKQIDFKDYFLHNDKNDFQKTIRSFHHEYSGLFVKKYAQFFEIPSPEYIHAIIQVCRGHRKVDLLDENEYPISYQLPSGNSVCLPYLSALLRLADEIDVSNARNCLIDYDLKTLTNEIDVLEFMKHEAVEDVEVTEKEFIVKVKTDDEKLYSALENAVKKMQSTLDLCRKTVNKRTKFTISQEKVTLHRL